MSHSARLTVLLTTSALLVSVFAAAGPGAAGARSSADRGAVTAISKRGIVGGHGRHARHKRKLGRLGTRRAVSDNVNLNGDSKKTSAPAPVPVPVPGLLFDGAHLSDFAELQQAPGAFQETPDPLGSGETSFQIAVNDRDVAPVTPTDNPRAQALSPDLIENGDEFWLSTKFMIPQNFPDVDGWMALIGVYGAPYNGTGPWGVEVCGDRLQWMRNRTYHYDVPWSMPLIKGSWVTVLLHERFAGDGWVEMWINGQQVNFFGREARLAMQTVDSSNGGGPNSARISQYREAGMFESGTLFFGPLKLGLTRESVGG